MDTQTDIYIHIPKGSDTNWNLVQFFRIWNLSLQEIYGYLCILFQNPAVWLVNFQLSPHTMLESWLGIWNLCQKTMGFGILYRNLVGVRTLTHTDTKAISRNQTRCSRHTPSLKSDAYLITEGKHCRMKHIKQKPKKILIRICM